MATFKKFEEIDAWKISRELTGIIYEITKGKKFSNDFVLKNQICRASISVMSNIAEGFERGGTQEFIQFLSIAKGSIGEIKSQLYIAHDQGYLDKKQFEEIYQKAVNTGRIIGGLIQYLKKSNIKGIKYR